MLLSSSLFKMNKKTMKKLCNKSRGGPTKIRGARGSQESVREGSTRSKKGQQGWARPEENWQSQMRKNEVKGVTVRLKGGRRWVVVVGWGPENPTGLKLTSLKFKIPLYISLILWLHTDVLKPSTSSSFLRRSPDTSSLRRPLRTSDNHADPPPPSLCLLWHCRGNF